MRVRPILFSGPMVRKILDGHKTQTRRVLLPQPPVADWQGVQAMSPIEGKPGSRFRVVGPDWPDTEDDDFFVPHAPGDLLWVRETGHCYHWDVDRAVYRADYDDGRKPCRVRKQIESYEVGRWTPSIHMPRWASRLTLEVFEVRVERLQDISEADALAEGIEAQEVITDVNCYGGMPVEHYETRYFNGTEDDDEPGHESAVEAFADLWDHINAKRGCGWDANPWVAATTFSHHAKNIDLFLAEREAA